MYPQRRSFTAIAPPVALCLLSACGAPEPAAPAVAADEEAIGIDIPLPIPIPTPTPTPTPSGPGSLSTDPAQVLFGQVCPGARSSRTLNLRNQGATALVLRTISVDASGFTLQLGQSLPYRLLAGATLPVKLSYRAPAQTAEVQATATLRITSSDSKHPNLDLALRAILAKPNLALSDREIELGDVVVGKKSSRTLTVRNAGVCATVLGDVGKTGTGAAQLSIDAPPPILMPGESAGLKLQLACKSAGDIQARLRFRGSGGQELTSASVTGACIGSAQGSEAPSIE